ncbi:MAG: hypothetical protein C0404_12655 [Verrucomicrobia bacterium]|nr:hypothetical protein [Verrucomicrobiota bacterium]
MKKEDAKRHVVPVLALFVLIITYFASHSVWLFLGITSVVLGALGYLQDLWDLKFCKLWHLGFLIIFLVSSIVTAVDSAPQSLSLYTKEIARTADGFAVTLTFSPSKNEELARITFEAQIKGDTQTRLIDLDPVGPSITWSNGKHISEDGKFIGMFYSLPAFGFPKVTLRTSGPAKVEFRGSHNLKPIRLEIK